MFTIISSYCAALESFNLIKVNKEIRSFVLAAKTIQYRQLFGAQKAKDEGHQIQKYFKIMENTGSRDLFVFYEMLVWAIREDRLDFVIE